MRTISEIRYSSDQRSRRWSAAAAAANPPGENEEPYMSYKRKRIIAREKNKELREKKAKEAPDAKAAVAAARAGLKAERARARAR